MIFNYYIILVNCISFILYYIDKKNAIKHKYRIPEKVLILFSIIGGSFGCTLGMNILHHKTKHTKFIIINYLFLGILVYCLLRESTIL